MPLRRLRGPARRVVGHARHLAGSVGPLRGPPLLHQGAARRSNHWKCIMLMLFSFMGLQRLQWRRLPRMVFMIIPRLRIMVLLLVMAVWSLAAWPMHFLMLPRLRYHGLM